jgi:glyoxylase-like metal-dependent hydrolase (beta-lactamase superfamily II)
MRRFLKIALGTLAVLAALAAGAWLWLTAREEVPEETSYTISLEQLRALAGSQPGAKPVEIRSALVAEASLPRAGVFAGESFEPHTMVHQVFQAVYPDGAGSLVIDTAFPQAALARMDENGKYDPDAFAQVVAALASARWIVVTHEHADHLGGVASVPSPESLVGRLRLTRPQLENTRAADAAALPAALRAMAPFDYAGSAALAPGAALLAAPGHTPGTQLVFVQTGAGAEYLFVGDVAWHMDQLTQLHYRPRLVTNFFIGEDRKAVMGQFRALHELMRQEPELVVVVSHDREQRARLLAEGKLRDGLVP